MLSDNRKACPQLWRLEADEPIGSLPEEGNRNASEYEEDEGRDCPSRDISSDGVECDAEDAGRSCKDATVEDQK